MPKGLKLHLPFSKISRILWKHLTNFLKTDLTKFAVIWVKRVIKVGFVSPRSSKITVTKAWKGEKKKERGVNERRRSKKAMVALTFISRLWWPLLAGRNSWTQKADLAVDYEYSSYFLRDSRANDTRARVKIIPREKRWEAEVREKNEGLQTKSKLLTLCVALTTQNSDWLSPPRLAIPTIEFQEVATDALLSV